MATGSRAPIINQSNPAADQPNSPAERETKRVPAASKQPRLPFPSLAALVFPPLGPQTAAARYFTLPPLLPLSFALPRE